MRKVKTFIQRICYKISKNLKCVHLWHHTEISWKVKLRTNCLLRLHWAFLSKRIRESWKFKVATRNGILGTLFLFWQFFQITQHFLSHRVIFLCFELFHFLVHAAFALESANLLELSNNNLLRAIGILNNNTAIVDNFFAFSFDFPIVLDLLAGIKGLAVASWDGVYFLGQSNLFHWLSKLLI